jgi:hypothetical protein
MRSVAEVNTRRKVLSAELERKTKDIFSLLSNYKDLTEADVITRQHERDVLLARIEEQEWFRENSR